MNIKRFFGIVLSILMVLAVIPTAALAEEVGAAAHEKAMLKLLDDAWEVLDRVEAEAIASGADKSEVTLAVYNAALQLKLVDEKSINSVTAKSFFFTVNGMACCYDYVARNVPHVSAIDDSVIAAAVESMNRINAIKNGPTSMNVLLVGPYYDSDSSFTDQYVNESENLASFTGGECIQLVNANATGPNIAEAYPECGIVIYDSHGTAGNGTSYLCLTTTAGITTEDYNNGWAVNGSGGAYIDGRYIQHHVTSELPNTIVWMAICEGMKSSGRGTTGTALLEAGAGCVYGYSQSVSFRGDYIYEATFWSQMMDGATVAEAFNYMTATHGNWDPAYSSSSGSAWPIVMSPDDPFPSNPDSHQTVNCDWTIMGGDMEPVAIESWSLNPGAIEIYIDNTATVRFNAVPDNANIYELVWHSENERIATVSGNNKRVNVTGVSIGSTRIYCEVKVEGETIGVAYCTVNVTFNTALSSAAESEGSSLIFSTDGTYPWVPVTIDGRNAAKSGNAGANSTSSSMYLTLNMKANETVTFEWKVSSESNYDFLYFFVNGTQNGSGISGTTNWATKTFTATTAGVYTFEWRFTKDYSVASGSDCGYVDNVTYNRAYQIGDVNEDGVIDSADALLILRYSMGLGTLSAYDLQNADVNGDGIVDSSDALLLHRR